MLFTVIIPTNNRPGRLAKCLSALRIQTIGPELFEIIVVDDCSTLEINGTFQWPGDAPALRMIRHSTRKGPAAARNTGARSATGEYLAFTDDDCCPNPDWLAELCMASKKHPDKLLGGRVENSEPNNIAAKFNQALVTTLQELTFERPNWFFTSNNLCVAAQQFQSLGGFDELFLEAAGEDREFCHRWRLSGRTMSAIQSAVVYHFHPQSIRGFWAMHQRYGIAARKLHELEPGMRIPTALLVATLLRRGFWWATALSQAAIASGYFLRSSVVHSRHRSERSMKIDQLLLLDPELGNPGGHYASYAETLQRACVQQNMGFSALGGHRARLPAFDPINAEWVPRLVGGALVNPFIGAWRMEKQLHTHASGRLTPGTLVIAATANHRHYGALSCWMESLSEKAAPMLLVILRFPEYDWKSGKWYATTHLTRRGLARLESTARRREIRLIADSELLAAEYQRLTALPVTALPIPHMLPERLPQARTGDIMRIGYFGEARREKGFNLLVEAIDILAKSYRDTEFELVVQSYVREGYESQACTEGCARLKTCRLANFRVLEGSLDKEHFYQEFLACDAVLMPYIEERYKTRSSGVFTDAVAAGISVITTRGTWMHEQLAKGSGAGLTFPDGDASGLADSIIEMVQRRGEMHIKAGNGARNWRELHNPLRFLDAIKKLFA